MERIVGENATQKFTRDHSATGKQLFDWLQKHRDKQGFSSGQEKAYKELLFQMALKFNTPTGNSLLDAVFSLRGFWQKYFKAFKYKIIPGYAKRKGL
jgi:hypothetical protein